MPPLRPDIIRGISTLISSITSLKDPYGQNNLAENPVYEDRLKELQDLLASVLTTFDHPYELDNTELFLTYEYPSVVINTKAIGTDYISWWRDDFLWPPAMPAGKEIQD